MSMQMTTVRGLEPKSFKGDDGNQIEGATIHISETIDPSRGVGERVDHFFLSKAKLAALDFEPAPGQTVEIFYNRFGKVATMKLVDDTSAILVD